MIPVKHEEQQNHEEKAFQLEQANQSNIDGNQASTSAPKPRRILTAKRGNKHLKVKEFTLLLKRNEKKSAAFKAYLEKV